MEQPPNDTETLCFWNQTDHQWLIESQLILSRTTKLSPLSPCLQMLKCSFSMNSTDRQWEAAGSARCCRVGRSWKPWRWAGPALCCVQCPLGDVICVNPTHLYSLRSSHPRTGFWSGESQVKKVTTEVFPATAKLNLPRKMAWRPLEEISDSHSVPCWPHAVRLWFLDGELCWGMDLCLFSLFEKSLSR